MTVSINYDFGAESVGRIYYIIPKMVSTNRCGFKMVRERKTTSEGCRMNLSGVLFRLGYADKQYLVLIPRSTSEGVHVVRNANPIEMRGPVFQMMYRVTEA